MTYLFIVDNDTVYQMIFKTNIRIINPKIKIESYLNSQDAMDALHSIVSNDQLLPDAIFLDLSMPIMDGWHFLDEFDKLKQKIKTNIDVYVVSTAIDLDIKYKALENKNVKDYINKPFSTDLLQKVLQS